MCFIQNRFCFASSLYSLQKSCSKFIFFSICTWDNRLLLFTTHCLKITSFYLTCNYFESLRDAPEFLLIWWISPGCPLHVLHSFLRFHQIRSSFIILPDWSQFFLTVPHILLLILAYFLISLNFNVLSHKIKLVYNWKSRLRARALESDRSSGSNTFQLYDLEQTTQPPSSRPSIIKLVIYNTYVRKLLCRSMRWSLKTITS